jgi:hypothetical protein
MAEKELRRRVRHRSDGWKVTVEFNDEEGKHVVRTEVRDLSVSGAAILADQRELTGKVVKLLISPPAQLAGDEDPLKIRARVVSAARTPGVAQVRYGLSFIRLPYDGVDELEKILRALPSEARREEPVAAVAPPEDRALFRRGRLAQLRELADAKRAEAKKPDLRAERDGAISEALLTAYRYLKDLAHHLNVIRPVYAKTYVVPGVPDFKRLVWEEGKADFRTREPTPILKYYDHVSFRFKLSGEKEARPTLEYPASEKLKQFLDEGRIVYTAHDMYNARGAVEGAKFIIPCEVKASLLLYSQLDIGKLLLRTINVSGFGSLKQLLEPEAINESSLDELTAFILGENRGPGPLLLRRT